jgi:membrane associated rhomboid family serine protease
MNRPARILILLGLIALVFFVLTDPRLGIGTHFDGQEVTNIIDAANRAWWATLTGVVGSIMMVAIGLWVLSQRAGR